MNSNFLGVTIHFFLGVVDRKKKHFRSYEFDLYIICWIGPCVKQFVSLLILLGICIDYIIAKTNIHALCSWILCSNMF